MGRRSGQSAGTIGEALYLDHLRVLDGKDLVELLRGRWPGSFGLAGQTETEHDGVAIDLHAVDGRPDAVGQESSVPVEDLRAVAADPGPVDLGVQERRQQLEVEVAVGGFEVTGRYRPSPRYRVRVPGRFGRLVGAALRGSSGVMP